MNEVRSVSKLKRRSPEPAPVAAPAGSSANEGISLCDALDRVLAAGVCARGDLTISVAGVDLVYIGLSSIIASIETAQRSYKEAQDE